MAVPAPSSLSDLPKGHEFPPAIFELMEEDVSSYLDAVGDPNPVYLDRKLAPPLAVAARALGSLLGIVGLPAGTLHTGQEMDARGGVRFGVPLALAGRIGQRSERAGLIVSVIEFEVASAGSATAAVSGRTTVMMPAAAAAGGGS